MAKTFYHETSPLKRRQKSWYRLVGWNADCKEVIEVGYFEHYQAAERYVDLMLRDGKAERGDYKITVV